MRTHTALPPYHADFLAILAVVEATHGQRAMPKGDPGIVETSMRRLYAAWFIDGENNGFYIDENPPTHKGMVRLEAWSHNRRNGVGRVILYSEDMTASMMTFALREVGLLP